MVNLDPERRRAGFRITQMDAENTALLVDLIVEAKRCLSVERMEIVLH